MEIAPDVDNLNRLATHRETLGDSEGARAAYVDGRFDAALGGFRAAAAMREEDAACRVFIARCEKFLKDGAPAGWDGTWYMDQK